MKKLLKYMLLAGLVIVTIIVVISFTNPRTWFYKKPSFKGTPLEKNPALINSTFTEEKLLELQNFLKEESGTTSMLVFENGRMVFEYGDVTEISIITSCRKSLLVMLYGKYVENEQIHLQETIGAIGIDEDDGLLPIEKQAKIYDVLTSRSGVFHVPKGKWQEKQVIS